MYSREKTVIGGCSTPVTSYSRYFAFRNHFYDLQFPLQKYRSKPFMLCATAGLRLNPFKGWLSSSSTPSTGQMWGLVPVHLERLSAAEGAKAFMGNGSTGASKTGARPLVASSFLYIRDRERGRVSCTRKP